jgi:two-component system LytT family sensor kinase
MLSKFTRQCNNSAQALQRKILKKYLIKNSYQLFLIYMIYSSSDIKVIAMRSFSVALSAFIVFIANAQIIVYYKTKANVDTSFRNIQKRIFCTGYLMTLCITVLHHTILTTLIQAGFNIQPLHIIEIAEPWKVLVLMTYVSLLQYIFVYLIQNFTMTQYEKTRIEMQLLNLKASNAETVNLLLKQQIQPHFLFNALNTLKSLIRKRPEIAEDYLIRLSDFLRASFSDHPSGIATLHDELEICNNYMEMQKVRFGDAIIYYVDEASVSAFKQHMLPVFSLQPLLENAIKHNVATLTTPLSIKVYAIDDYIKVENQLHPKKTIDDSTGKGINNLKERYKILTGDEVIVEQDVEKFVVSIKLLKHENSHN